MNQTAKNLLEKYKKGNCTAAELALLESWYLIEDNQTTEITIEDLDNAKNKIWATLPVQNSTKNKLTKHWLSLPFNFNTIAAAAIITICLSFSLYFYINKQQAVSTIAKMQTSIVPGSNKAVLTLADGTTINLNKANNGTLANQPGAKIVSTNDGSLVYKNNTLTKSEEIQYNLLTIPRGGYYTITLIDGTKVWLNSESSLKYPTDFVGNERLVTLTGEAYFEVAHLNDKPFKVIANNQTVEVLGTHFNINSYKDENVIATTLLQGSVKVSTANKTLILNPGQQANVFNNNITLKTVNTDEVIAWVNNDFVFENEELGSIMRKIARWYDVDVICPTKMQNMQFSGSISRTKNINQVLKIMDLTETVNFKFEGRRITVMP
jgi:ferric-dicitrate binding protein FerR (iron transport regulator)